MYYYPAHYEPRYLNPPYDYFHYYHSPEFYSSRYGPRSYLTRYYFGNPYVSSYSDGRFELLRRPPFYSSAAPYSEEQELRLSRSLGRELSIPRSVRASSIPPRASSPPPGVEENLKHSTRASSVPPETAGVTFTPKIVHYSPKMVDTQTPTATYTYQTKVPVAPEDSPKKATTSNPVSFGPRIYTNLSVFPTMRHSSYSLLAPIDRYRYRTSTIPTKVYAGLPSTSYYSYPTPTSSTARAYRQSELYPTRFQINRITSPSVDSFHAGRRTLY